MNESMMHLNKFGAFPVGELDVGSTARLVDNPLAALSPARQDNLNEKENSTW